VRRALAPGVVVCGLLLLLAAQVVPVPATNFGGFDEWMVFELNQRGVVSVPYCHRPFNWIWSWPASRLVEISFAPFSWLYAAYAALTAGLAFWLVRRAFGGEQRLAVLTAAFTLVWAPGDLAHLSTVDRVLYAGETFGVLLALSLFVRAAFDGRLLALGAALGVGLVTALSYEGTLPLLLGVPPLLLLRDRSRLRLVLAWEALLLACAGWFAWQIAHGEAYQVSVLGAIRDPVVWTSRMAWQYAYHLGPLVLFRPSELWAPGVAASLLALALTIAPVLGAPGGRRGVLALAGVLGLYLAGLGYSLLAIGVSETTAFRMQILSGPGMALALAAIVELLASLAAGRLRAVAVAALSGFVVAVGAGRSDAMQRTWDQGSFCARQSQLLLGLTTLVPDVKPGTLLVLLDEGGAWRATYGFHHAVQYLYERRASGFVPGVWDALTPARFERDGVHFEPWAVNREAWDLPAVVFPYSAVIVLRHDGRGGLERLPAWPKALPALPPEARYDPVDRLAGRPLRRRALLSRLAEVPAYTGR
jgi:hypothetical protein